MKDEERYEENVGRPHRNLPEDHPDRWQWIYSGTREERADLLQRLAEETVEEQEAQAESLF